MEWSRNWLKENKRINWIKKNIEYKFVDKLSEGATDVSTEEIIPSSRKIKADLLITKIRNITPKK